MQCIYEFINNHHCVFLCTKFIRYFAIQYIVSLETYFESNIHRAVIVSIVQADLKKRGYGAMWSSSPENQKQTLLKIN